MIGKKYLFDSSFIVALFNPNDSQHSKARKEYEKLQNKRNSFLLHPLVFVETVNVLKMKVTQQILEKSQQLLLDPTYFHYEDVVLTYTSDDPSLSLFNKKNNLSLIDSTILYYCIEKNLNLITFDKDLASVYKRTKSLLNKLN